MSEDMSFTDYGFSQLNESDYGDPQWNKFRSGGLDVNQITIELFGFRANGKIPGYLSRFEHGLNLIRLLWKKEIWLARKWTDYRDGSPVVIYNHCFIEVFRLCCKGNRVGLTGAGATGKTFAVAAYVLLMFMCDPENTTVFVSTTAGSDAERRVWAEIKTLHRALEEIYPVGVCIDYLKAITFDPGQELEGRKDVKDRDLRNGLLMIPIPKGSEGEAAVGKIIGTHQRNIIWVIDELPHMMDNVLDGEGNLVKNIFYQLIGIGNANKKTDPHGDLCEPATGWTTITVNDMFWESADGASILFLNGERTPNYHPAVDQSSEDAEAYPFPFLSSPAMNRRLCRRFGRGNPELGRRTIEYQRFGIGFWHGGEVSNKILTVEFVASHSADKIGVVWSHKKRRVLCGADFGFTTGGDKNSLFFSTFGEDHDGNQALELDSETVDLIAMADSRKDFRDQIAAQVVEECTKRGVEPNDFGCDINADGGLMMQAIQKAWDTHDLVGLSSLEPASDDRFSNIVTMYWMHVPDVIGSGNVRGFNCESGYAKDLFERSYESVGKGTVSVEKKRDMKKRIKRSPDRGDAFCYNLEMAIRAGFELKKHENTPEENIEQFDVLFGGETRLRDGDVFESHGDADEEWENAGDFEYSE